MFYNKGQNTTLLLSSSGWYKETLFKDLFKARPLHFLKITITQFYTVSVLCLAFHHFCSAFCFSENSLGWSRVVLELKTRTGMTDTDWRQK